MDLKLAGVSLDPEMSGGVELKEAGNSGMLADWQSSKCYGKRSSAIIPQQTIRAIMIHHQPSTNLERREPAFMVTIHYSESSTKHHFKQERKKITDEHHRHM